MKTSAWLNIKCAASAGLTFAFKDISNPWYSQRYFSSLQSSTCGDVKDATFDNGGKKVYPTQFSAQKHAQQDI